MLFSVPKSLAFLLAVCSMVGPLSANTYMPGLGMIAEEYGADIIKLSDLFCPFFIIRRSHFRQFRQAFRYDGRAAELCVVMHDLCVQPQLRVFSCRENSDGPFCQYRNGAGHGGYA